MNFSTFLLEHQIAELAQDIAHAESLTSGEIRVHIDEKLEVDIQKRAYEVFVALGMDKTEQKNGVLIYITTETQQFLICGDKGINKKVPAFFWRSTRNMIKKQFKKGLFYEGLRDAVFEAGIQLQAYFPVKPDDVDELDNHITFNNQY